MIGGFQCNPLHDPASGAGNCYNGAMRRVLVAALLLCSCSIKKEEWFGKVDGEIDPTHLRICNSAEPESWDPGLATTTTDLPIVYAHALFDGLTAWDANGLSEASMAREWTISPDFKTFTFKLRDDLRWSDGTPITSTDFVYTLARNLHPITASRNAADLWKIRHGQIYTEGRAKVVLRDSGPFHAGDVVKVLPVKGADDKDKDPPSSNVRRTRAAATLSADPDAASPVWKRLAPNTELTLIELGGPGCAAKPRQLLACDWAYVHDAEGDGRYGWTPVAGLVAPNDDRDYQVESAPDLDEKPPRKAVIKGRDLVMVPDLLGLDTPDPLTLVMQTWGPVPYLINLTSQRAWRPVPRHPSSRWPLRWTYPDHIVTSGEFHLTYWHRRDKFEMVKSKTFWGRDQVKLDRVTYFSMNDQSANASVYYQGGCDTVVANNIPNTYFPVLAGERDGLRRRDYHRSPFLGIYYYIINTKKLTNVHLRRALSHSLDRSVLPYILKGGQFPTYSGVPGEPFSTMSDENLALCGAKREDQGVGMIVETGKLCYRPPLGPTFDVEAAKRELQIAKDELGKDFPSKITIKFNTGVEYHKTIAEWIQHEWMNKLGLTIELESQEWNMYTAATSRGEFEVARFGGILNFPDPESEFLSNYKCTAPENRPKWCSEEFDKLFREVEATTDRKERLALVHKADELFTDAAALIPLYVYTQHRLIKPWVRDFAPNLTDHHQLRRVWIDPNWREHPFEAAKVVP
jgi:oligopeptide transport system substrate-binding protein